MVIQPKIRGFICTTAHPVGCAYHVQEQIDWIKDQGSFKGPQKVLVIGASNGYGLASRVATAFGAGASTIGLFFEKPASGKRTATPGWYNNLAFEKAAKEAGLYAESLNGDAFSNALKVQTIEKIKENLKEVDLVIYSLASPRRTHPLTGETHSSVLKPIGAPYSGKTVNVQSGEVSQVDLQAATEDEISDTVAVMGGEDWQMWMEALEGEGVLADGIRTVAYSYIGPELTKSIYRDGTIGIAKNHIETTVQRLDDYLKNKNGKAYISVNKAVVTMSSAAIPVVPLYISLLYKLDFRQKIIEKL